MYTLRIWNDETASACLFKSGKLIAAVSEERFTRIKQDNTFPKKSIQFVLDFEKIKISDITTVAYSWFKGSRLYILFFIHFLEKCDLKFTSLKQPRQLYSLLAGVLELLIY